MALLSTWSVALFIIGVCLPLATATPVVLSGEEVLSRPAHIPVLHDARGISCFECKILATTLDAMMAAGGTVEEIENFVINECINFDLFPADVCSGMVKLCAPEVLYVFNNTDYNHDTICGWLLGATCQSTELEPWTLEIPSGKPEPSHPEPEQPPPSVVRILHLSDTHVDLQYDEGSAITCAHPYCCRHAFGDPAPGEEGAGHWGAYANCDIPLHTLEELMAQAAHLIKPDLVYVTGDLPPHDVWDQDHSTNLAAIVVTVGLLKQYFPDVPVINALGNHASAPVNSFVVPAAYDSGWSMSWLYDAVAELWSEWLPEDTLDDVRRGGFFSYSPLPGLRVVSLNNNFCNTQNWWLLLENKDPTGELQWLVETLAAAEAAGEAVHILGHIPPGGGDCDHTWSHIFNEIVVRYESTIRGMFFGHTHRDSWQLVYDPASNYTRPVATAFVTPSGTSSTDRNSAFKVFEVDGGHEAATWALLNADTYYMNLTEANAEGGSPIYTTRYSIQSSYGVPSASPNSMHQIVLNMVTDEELLKTHEWNTHNTWVDVPDSWSCDTSCLKGKLCGLVSSDSSSRDACHNLEEYIDAVSS